MKSSPRLCFAAACLLAPMMQEAQGAPYYSRPEFANESVGLVETEFRDGFYRGSATVARDPRIIYSCAHLVYDRGVWAEDYTFHRAWHSKTYPARRLGASPRGFHYFTEYAKAARYTNGESNASFANDFIVFYGSQSFGPAARVQEYSGSMLRSTTRQKRILGYPSDIDYTGGRGYCYQHSTGWFAKRAFRIREEYYDFYGVSTGSGNSGGGIFLRDLHTGEDLLAGILVSGGYSSAGVVAMDADTRSLASQAIGSSRSPLTITNANRISVEETGGTLVRSFPVYEVDGTMESLALDLKLSAIGGDAPAVFLQAPSGRMRRVAVPEAEQGIIRIDRKDTGDAFRGAATKGTWLVRVHADSALTFERACLHGVSSD